MTLISRYVFPALLLSLLAGCEERTASEEFTTPISEDSYVAVMAELARVRRRPPHARGQIERDRLADSVRTEVLLRHGVTAAELIEFADVAADSIETSTIRADSIRADSVAQIQLSDRPDSLLESDTLVADSIRVIGDSSESRTVEPGARFADPDLNGVADTGVQAGRTADESDSVAVTDSLNTRETVPPAGAAPIQPRSGRARRPARRPPAPAADSTSD
jgi:hypothetical protein